MTNKKREELYTVLTDLDKSIQKVVKFLDDNADDSSIARLFEIKYPFGDLAIHHVAFDVYEWREAILLELGMENYVAHIPVVEEFSPIVKDGIISAINDIERWEGEAYQPPNQTTDYTGDEVYLAIRDLKRLVNYPLKKYYYDIPVPCLWTNFDSGEVMAFDEYDAHAQATEELRAKVNKATELMKSEGFEIHIDYGQMNIGEVE